MLACTKQRTTSTLLTCAAVWSINILSRFCFLMPLCRGLMIRELRVLKVFGHKPTYRKQTLRLVLLHDGNAGDCENECSSSRKRHECLCQISCQTHNHKWWRKRKLLTIYPAHVEIFPLVTGNSDLLMAPEEKSENSLSSGHECVYWCVSGLKLTDRYRYKKRKICFIFTFFWNAN